MIYDTIALDRLVLAAKASVSPALAQHMSISQWEDFVTGNLVYQVKTEVLAHRLPPEEVTSTKAVEFKEPASVWQHWKRDHAPDWFTRRWPVRYVEHFKTVKLTVRLDRYRTFPEATIAYPDYLGAPIRFVQTTKWWEVTP